ncbi:MAG TPA: STAS domain-containing protein [Acidimicrobiales bacterium]|nr:STAS domain-containing protein [Acidimicrobiales bacterium]
MTTEADFTLTPGEERGVPVVTVGGEVDLATAPRLAEHLEGLGESGATTVVVDLTEVRFVDSTALGVLVAAMKRLRAGGGDLRLVVTEPHLAKVFSITGLDDVFAIYPTTADAVSA